MRNVSDENCREKQKHPFSFLKKSWCFFDIKWKKIFTADRPQITTWRMRISFWIRKATNMHSEYVIRIAFPLQQWLRERASLLSYTYIACLVPYFLQSRSKLDGVFMKTAFYVSHLPRAFRPNNSPTVAFRAIIRVPILRRQCRTPLDHSEPHNWGPRSTKIILQDPFLYNPQMYV